MFVKVLKVSDIQPKEIRCVTVQGNSILICNSEEGELFAVENRCSHAGQPLADGKIRGNNVVCAAHGASFDLETGKATCPPAFKSITTYPLRIEQDDIEVEIETNGL